MFNWKKIDVSKFYRFPAKSPLSLATFVTSKFFVWEPIDETFLQVILKFGSFRLSGIFFFDEIGKIICFTAEYRYREVDGKFIKKRWTGHYRKYEKINGFKILTEMEFR